MLLLKDRGPGRLDDGLQDVGMRGEIHADKPRRRVQGLPPLSSDSGTPGTFASLTNGDAPGILVRRL